MSKWFVGQRVYAKWNDIEGNGTVSFVDEINTEMQVRVKFDNKAGLWWIWSQDVRPIEGSTFDPIRTVTRREIVPGVYGRVHVGPTDVDSVVVSIGTVGQVQRFTSEELREAAHIFNQLAEALDDA